MSTISVLSSITSRARCSVFQASRSMTPRSPKEENDTSGRTSQPPMRSRCPMYCSVSRACRAFISRSRSPPRHRTAWSTRISMAPAMRRTTSPVMSRAKPRSSLDTVWSDTPASRARSPCRSPRRIRTARMIPPSRRSSIPRTMPGRDRPAITNARRARAGCRDPAPGSGPGTATRCAAPARRPDARRPHGDPMRGAERRAACPAAPRRSAAARLVARSAFRLRRHQAPRHVVPETCQIDAPGRLGMAIDDSGHEASLHPRESPHARVQFPADGRSSEHPSRAGRRNRWPNRPPASICHEPGRAKRRPGRRPPAGGGRRTGSSADPGRLRVRGRLTAIRPHGRSNACSVSWVGRVSCAPPDPVHNPASCGVQPGSPRWTTDSRAVDESGGSVEIDRPIVDVPRMTLATTCSGRAQRATTTSCGFGLDWPLPSRYRFPVARSSPSSLRSAAR
jgi:hypothetical protein